MKKTEKMKILIAGEWRYEVYEQAISDAFRRLEFSPVHFCWRDYLTGKAVGSGFLGKCERIWRHVQEKFLIGPLVYQANLAFCRKVEETRPDLIFVFRGTHLFPEVLARVRKRFGIPIIGYNNDDPFGKGHPFYLWRFFNASLPVYDLVFAYREHNLPEFRAAGARRVELLPSWFIPERDRPLELSAADHQRFDCDVVFVGHHEDDGRVQCFERIVEAGFSFRLFGMGRAWDPIVARSPQLRHLAPVQWVRNDDYAKSLCGAKVALCFLSKKNRDSYTRRCFEIPATRTFLLSEYTDYQATLFQEGREIEFFRNADELLAKVRSYVADSDRRRAVAQAGYQRVYQDGHDVVSRTRGIIAHLTQSGLLRGNGRAVAVQPSP
jgi:spore maturation protein CgeB